MEGSLWPMLGMFGDGKYRSQRPLALYASTESGQTYPLWSSSNLVADSPNTMLPVQATLATDMDECGDFNLFPPQAA